MGKAPRNRKSIDPKTAERYFVTDGQKDIAACFDRRTSRVIAALKYDWEPNDQNLAMGWRNGGTLKISRIYPDPATGRYDYLGTKGQKQFALDIMALGFGVGVASVPGAVSGYLVLDHRIAECGRLADRRGAGDYLEQAAAIEPDLA
jgi:hypothetical protein